MKISRRVHIQIDQMKNSENLKRQEEEIKDKLLEAIHEKSIYSIRTLRKKLKAIQKKEEKR